ncbi:fluoride efflux transporter CrcB [Novosphingobium sp. APW14]|jgi:CrcB protein|uniref:fluoride efflux transporter CrcB n=1 Tax=Novosphingobium sp. APW14 TaxID=3077237 RepID=UPI0028E0182B|nr:fluoride efflux transporter CrcB [Novosphingobium sp. APW14]MDT9013215.1 fluoride efflux transporter CrcB [Novosphingobium sp. APW14]
MTAQPSFVVASLSVAAGGGVGAWLRFAVGRMIGATPFPVATLTINVLGSIAMGLLAGWLARHSDGGEQWRLLLGVGVLGGFTTFSAFSLEIALMIERGAMTQAAIYIALSLLGGVGGLFAGLALARGIA